MLVSTVVSAVTRLPGDTRRSETRPPIGAVTLVNVRLSALARTVASADVRSAAAWPSAATRAS